AAHASSLLPYTTLFRSPPRSTVVGAAVRVWVTTSRPAFGARGEGGGTVPASVGAVRFPHAASVSAEAPRLPVIAVRREILFTGAVLLCGGSRSVPEGVQDTLSALFELVSGDLSSSKTQ